MPHFKDPSGNLHFIDDRERIAMLPPGCEEIADADAAPKLSVQEMERRAIATINSRCDAALAAVTAGYPASEISSWPKQEAEARAWLADSATPTPLLAALAQARGITIHDLAARVVAKADAFAVAAGTIIGQRQALEDQVSAITADPNMDDDQKRMAVEEAIK